MSVENVMAEVARGIPVVGHAYGKADNCTDPQDRGIGSAVAAFLIAMGECVAYLWYCNIDFLLSSVVSFSLFLSGVSRPCVDVLKDECMVPSARRRKPRMGKRGGEGRDVEMEEEEE
jgi:hypothetical protein